MERTVNLRFGKTTKYYNMETVKWDVKAAFEKASKGSFAEKAVRIDVYKNNNEIFKAGCYETERGTVVNIKESNAACLSGTKVYSKPIRLGDIEEEEFKDKFKYVVFAILEAANGPQGRSGKFAPFYNRFS